jgi:hypothetical protein
MASKPTAIWNDATEAYLLEVLDEFPPMGPKAGYNMFAIARHIHTCVFVFSILDYELIVACCNRKSGIKVTADDVRSQIEKLYNIEELVCCFSVISDNLPTLGL